MNILPPLATAWWHFAKRALGDRVDVTIFDCSGKLDPEKFEGARVQPFLNFYAATKCQEFFCKIGRNRKIVWMCDDDMFLLSQKCVDIVEREFADPNTASVSFRPRPWWEFQLDHRGKPSASPRVISPEAAAKGEIVSRGDTRHPVSSSYCTAVNRHIFCEKEKLSLSPVKGNPHPTLDGKKPKSYDTFDKANEILLQKGYKCVVVPEDERSECVTGFSGMSNGVMLLNYFKTPEQTIEYFLTPAKDKWQGTVLHDAFGAMLAIDVVQDLYEKITGERYPLPSLPSHEELMKIRGEHEGLLREGKSWGWVDEVATRLRTS